MVAHQARYVKLPQHFFWNRSKHLIPVPEYSEFSVKKMTKFSCLVSKQQSYTTSTAIVIMAIKTYRARNAEEIQHLRDHLEKTNTKPKRSHENPTVQNCALLCTYFRQAYWRGNPKTEEKTGRYCFSPDDIKALEQLYYEYRHVSGITLLKDKIDLDDESQCFPALMCDYNAYASFFSSSLEEKPISSDDDQSHEEVLSVEEELRMNLEFSNGLVGALKARNAKLEARNEELKTRYETSKVKCDFSIMTYTRFGANTVYLACMTYLYVMACMYVSTHITYE